MLRRVLEFLFIGFVLVGRLDGQQAATTTLSGTVVLNGSPLPGVTIDVSGPVSRTTVTDSDGGFRIPELPPGQYRVNATMSGFAKKSLDVNVRIGASETLMIELAPDPISTPAIGGIRGTVKSGRSPIEGVLVRIRPVDNNESVTQHTAEDGTYEQDDLAPGRYEVTASAKDYEPQSKRATVKNGKITTVNFSLRKTRKR